MSRAAATLLALAALTVAVASGPVPARAAVERHCGDVPYHELADIPQDVRALHVSCRTARRLALRHYLHAGRNERCDLAKPSCRLDGWTCRRSFFGNGGTRVRCTAGNRRVRWFHGA